MELSIKALSLSLNHQKTREIGGFNEGQRPLYASAIRVVRTSSRNKVVLRGQAKSDDPKLLLKPSCRDRGATTGQPNRREAGK